MTRPIPRAASSRYRGSTVCDIAITTRVTTRVTTPKDVAANVASLSVEIITLTGSRLRPFTFRISRATQPGPPLVNNTNGSRRSFENSFPERHRDEIIIRLYNNSGYRRLRSRHNSARRRRGTALGIISNLADLLGGRPSGLLKITMNRSPSKVKKICFLLRWRRTRARCF